MFSFALATLTSFHFQVRSAWILQCPAGFTTKRLSVQLLVTPHIAEFVLLCSDIHLNQTGRNWASNARAETLELTHALSWKTEVTPVPFLGFRNLCRCGTQLDGGLIWNFSQSLWHATGLVFVWSCFHLCSEEPKTLEIWNPSHTPI